MKKAIDFRTVDKTQFKCYQMADGTVYYGEVAYLDKATGKLYQEGDAPKDVELDHVRHGHGIQLYGRNGADKLCYFSGKWDKDLKHGDGGLLIFPDGVSQYIGGFRNNVFEGQGDLVLKVGEGAPHHYTGGFKEGKLEGKGKFEHGLTKQSFGPDFSNDHFIYTQQLDRISERRLRALSPRS